MQTENLKIEHMHYLLKSFALSIDADFLTDLTSSETKDLNASIDDYLPKIIGQASLELQRCNLGDVVMIMETFYKIWNKSSDFDGRHMIRVYDASASYLD